MFVVIDEDLDIIVFTYPNLKTIRRFLKKKIKSLKIQSDEKNVPTTYLPKLYKTSRYEHPLQNKDKTINKIDNVHDNTYNGKEEHINEYKEKNNFIIKKNKSYVDDFHTSTFDIFSDENLNLFMHTYKNIYVLNNMENIITCNEKNKKINYEYKQNESQDDDVFMLVENMKRGSSNKKHIEKNYKCISKKEKKNNFYSLLKVIEKTDYIFNDLYLNPTYKILRICFLPSSIHYVVYLAYVLINNNHYLFVTIVNYLSKPVYKYMVHILINNIVQNEEFSQFFMKSYDQICSGHLMRKEKLLASQEKNKNKDESIIINAQQKKEKKYVMCKDILNKYLSTLKIAIINNRHIILYGSCLLSLIEIKNYNLNSSHNPYVKEYEYKYLKLIFNLYCFEHFSNVYDTYVNKLSYDLKHHLVKNDLFKKERKNSHLFYLNKSGENCDPNGDISKGKDRYIQKKEQVNENMDIYNNNNNSNRMYTYEESINKYKMNKNDTEEEYTFYIFSLFNDIYMLTNGKYKKMSSIEKMNDTNKGDDNRSLDVLFNYNEWKIIKLKNDSLDERMKICTFQGVMNMNINYYYNKNYYKSNISLNPCIQSTIQRYNIFNEEKRKGGVIQMNYQGSIYPDVYILRELKYGEQGQKKKQAYYYNFKDEQLLTLYDEGDCDTIDISDKYKIYTFIN